MIPAVTYFEIVTFFIMEPLHCYSPDPPFHVITIDAIPQNHLIGNPCPLLWGNRKSMMYED
ncbi:hypothetical protein CHS0354_000279 [Potamilus streckersoni]|uniref:Uncharacterized protein n=1 Tax=Potamilus streckersoni TaxID=2493646 RepID=A0AAE0RYU4_9BIVA|nr:hypothetical protein CHS0354_000279 [Potamilus streckersoni]